MALAKKGAQHPNGQSQPSSGCCGSRGVGADSAEVSRNWPLQHPRSDGSADAATGWVSYGQAEAQARGNTGPPARSSIVRNHAWRVCRRRVITSDYRRIARVYSVGACVGVRKGPRARRNKGLQRLFRLPQGWIEHAGGTETVTGGGRGGLARRALAQGRGTAEDRRTVQGRRESCRVGRRVAHGASPCPHSLSMFRTMRPNRGPGR